MSIRWPKYACTRCGMKNHWCIRRCFNLGGQETHLFVCTYCGERTQDFISKAAAVEARAAGFEILDIPPGYQAKRPKCEVCGAEGAENHHWAPYALFGGEADSWPQSFLCQPCHQRWHAIVTPKISAQRRIP